MRSCERWYVDHQIYSRRYSQQGVCKMFLKFKLNITRFVNNAFWRTWKPPIKTQPLNELLFDWSNTAI